MDNNKNNRIFYSGRTCFMGKDVPFEIENYVIRIFVEKDEKIDNLFMEETAKGSLQMRSRFKPLDMDSLVGLTNDGQHYITVFFDRNRYSPSNVLFPGIVTFHILFHHLIVTDLLSIKRQDGCYIGMTSKCFYKFLSMVPHYSIDDIEERKFSLGLNFPSQKLVAHIKFENADVEIKPGVEWSNNGSSFDYSPGLSFKFSRTIGKKTAINFVDKWIELLNFLFMRTNIYPDLIRLSIGTNTEHLYVAKPEQEKDTVEDLNVVCSDSIEWCDIYKHIPAIFDHICKGDLYMLNLQDSIKERLSAGIYTAGLDAAAFESEYSKLYPKGFKHSAQTIKAEREVSDQIKRMISESSGRKRKIYKKLQKVIELETLQNKMEAAFKENETCLKQLKEKYAPELNYAVISANCANFRNDVDHGNKNGKISKELVCSFIMLRGLVYSMQLKRCGVNDESIDGIVFKLFNIKV